MINVNDTVGYSRAFLKSIGCLTGDLPRAKGKVIKIDKMGSLQIAYINWDLPDIPEKVNVKNLAKVGTVAYVD